MSLHLLRQIFHTAAQHLREHHKGLGLGLVDALLPLLILLNCANRNVVSVEYSTMPDGERSAVKTLSVTDTAYIPWQACEINI